MTNELSIYNDKVCHENYRYCAECFPESRNNIGDYILDFFRIVTEQNPVSVVADTLGTAIKSFVFLKNRKYQLTALKYMSDLECRKIQAVVEVNHMNQQERIVTLAIEREFQRSIKIIENNKLIAMAKIDADLQKELRKYDIREREIARQIVLCNALFSQNIKNINRDSKTKANVIRYCLDLMGAMPREFLRNNGKDWLTSNEKKIADDFFNKIILLLDKHYDYIDIEQFISAMR